MSNTPKTKRSDNADVALLVGAGEVIPSIGIKIWQQVGNSTGSNFCLAPSIVAKMNGVPAVNVESAARFTRAGKTAKILAKSATLTALHWEEQKKILPKGTVFGPLLAKPEVEPCNDGYILVTGATYGHRLLF